ncbi:MAG: hypothetical protein ACOYUB_00550 [Patescibacteria group bacterium]
MSVKSQDVVGLKKKLKTIVSEQITDILVSGEVPYKKIQEMAVDLLDTLDYVETKEQFALLVKQMAEFYPFLKNQATIMEAELKETQEQQVINKLESYFKSLSH